MSENDRREQEHQRQSRSDRSDRPRRRRMQRKGRRRKEDFFHATNTTPSYKQIDVLRRFLTDRGKIRPRRQTGLTAKNQRLVAREIKRARHMALLPFTDDQTRA